MEAEQIKIYLQESFINHFASYRGKKLVLYGLGNDTKILLDEFPEYHFIGLMDGVRTGDMVWGLPVLTCGEARELGADAIIILARPVNIPVIYQRIAEFCEKYLIPVFDINGNHLSLQKKHVDKIDCEKEEVLYRKIDCSQIVSFDIFDTLLMRRVLFPTDIFIIAEQKLRENGCEYPFLRERKKAEQELLREGKQPKLGEIYDRMVFHDSSVSTHKKKWMELEIDIEKEYLLVRDKMKKMLEYVRQSGKQVVFVSDTCLPAEVLSELLRCKGISVLAEEALVSCQCGVSKSSGLYCILRNRFPKQRILHIGHDFITDEQCAKAWGIDDVFLVNSVHTLLGLSKANRFLMFDDMWMNRIIMGEFAAKQFANPFVFEKTAGKIYIHSEYDFGYYFLAPILIVFIRWLLKKAEEYKITRLLLSSRDGYIIKGLLDEAYKKHTDCYLPEYTYFYTSRSVCVRAALKEKKDILYAAEQIPFSGTAKELLQQRFGLKEEEILPEKDVNESDADYIVKHEKAILRHSCETRHRYKRYLLSLKIRDTDCCGFFDFVSGGTCQYALNKIWDTKMKGLYFLKFYDPVKADLSIDALYGENNAYVDGWAMTKKYFLLERVITAFEPTLMDFDEKGKPVFGKETRSQEELNSLRIIHRGILDAFLKYDLADVNFADEFIRLLDEDYAVCKFSFLQSAHVTDEFCNRSFNIPGCSVIN